MAPWFLLYCDFLVKPLDAVVEAASHTWRAHNCTYKHTKWKVVAIERILKDKEHYELVCSDEDWGFTNRTYTSPFQCGASKLTPWAKMTKKNNSKTGYNSINVIVSYTSFKVIPPCESGPQFFVFNVLLTGHIPVSQCRKYLTSNNVNTCSLSLIPLDIAWRHACCWDSYTLSL